jgi:hypothetical protein
MVCTLHATTLVGALLGGSVLGIALQKNAHEEDVSFLQIHVNASSTAKTQTSPKMQLSSGEACGTSLRGSEGVCNTGLSCLCLALNRGLHTCMQQDLLAIPKLAHQWQRRGLSCESKLPDGLEVMPPPPVAASGIQLVDPRRVDDTKLRQWALGHGRSHYTQYAVVHAPGSTSVGVPVLAGSDVSKEKLKEFVGVAEHFLRVAPRDNQALALSLAAKGVRILVAGDYPGAWRKHPEVKRHFKTGLGGGAPWFPSTGVQVGEPSYSLMEELFHTIQYVSMQPHDVCMYHKAYSQAVANGLYTTDGSGPEVDGEPVPTVQADEYLAMALQRWVGVDAKDSEDKEYAVPGSSKKEGSETGREYLRKLDPHAFCLISKVFRSDDTWNPDSKASPWKTNPNRGMDIDEVDKFCEPVISKLAVGCPTADLQWAYLA